MADPRGISVTTPLGPDAIFLTGFRGREGLSQLFDLDVMAENRQAVAFDILLGQTITWSIILPNVKFELQGTFEPRDYCAQYRESDFNFASRLMEEGIYYLKHSDGGHQMIVANSPQSHPATIFADKAIDEELEGGIRPDMSVTRWEKAQELRSGKVTLWDHHFELPHQHLDAERPTQESVAVGKVTHKLKLPANDALELFDYPGAYTQPFDGVDRGGGDQAGEIANIFQDNKRTAAIRMEQEASQAIVICGAGNWRITMLIDVEPTPRT